MSAQGKQIDRAEIRRLVADYMATEGCSCCEGERHQQDEKALAELLNVPKYPDGSGYNFAKFRSKP